MEEKIENLRRELAADPDSSEDRLEYFASLRRASDESALALIADSARWKAAAPRDRDIALAWLQPKLGDSWDILGPCESAGDGELRFRHRGLGRDFLLINDGPPAPLLLARKSMAPSEFPARVQQTARGRLEVKAGPAEAWLREAGLRRALWSEYCAARGVPTFGEDESAPDAPDPAGEATGFPRIAREAWRWSLHPAMTLPLRPVKLGVLILRRYISGARDPELIERLRELHEARVDHIIVDASGCPHLADDLLTRLYRVGDALAMNGGRLVLVSAPEASTGSEVLAAPSFRMLLPRFPPALEALRPWGLRDDHEVLEFTLGPPRKTRRHGA